MEGIEEIEFIPIKDFDDYLISKDDVIKNKKGRICTHI